VPVLGPEGLWPSSGSPPSTPVGSVCSAHGSHRALLSGPSSHLQCTLGPGMSGTFSGIQSFTCTHSPSGEFVFQRLINLSWVVFACEHVFPECGIPVKTGGSTNKLHALIRKMGSVGGAACKGTEPGAWLCTAGPGWADSPHPPNLPCNS